MRSSVKITLDALILIAVLALFALLYGCAAPERRWPDPVQVPSGEAVGTYSDKDGSCGE
jgi:hypothetical protein